MQQERQEEARLNRFRKFFINNNFVLFLLILLLVGVNIYIFAHITFVFSPLIALVKTVLLPLLLAGVAYYLLNPMVDWMENRGLKRGWVIAALYIIIIGFLTVLVTIVIPVVRLQIQGLIQNFPLYIKYVQDIVTEYLGSNIVLDLQREFNVDLQQIATELSQRAGSIFQTTLTNIGGFLGTVTEFVLALVTLPFILFYMLRDGKKLPEFILKLLPTSLRPETRRVLSESNDQISSYIRGQIIVSICIGILLYIGYLIIGLQYSLVLAIAAACTAVVPYIGPVIAITPALIVAAFTSPIMLLKMIVVWTIVQLIEGKFISPQIMGKTLKIHPITIIFVILTSGKLFGFLGIILAVPGYAVLKVFVIHLFGWFMVNSKLYGPEPEYKILGVKRDSDLLP
ncbi:AI-2E family transporter [Paenibacillus herberti]|uniref:AI-2E family transporter n=1 Tax=Paenibacillus herberti TaxID=1619309 RepID=A0A229NVI2_9BACL|nr:AI-2E family transporter [Paenibacillus herberti]OXM13848.1 AI-2E family transporter [Paenibacillus herberti]